MFTKENVISAKLINEEHTTIEVVHTIEGDDKVHSYILEYDKDSQDFKALEKAGWDLERVTEETMTYKREASRIHNESIAAAAQQWLEANPTTIENIVNVTVTDIIGSIIDKNEDEDTLFKAKLAAMELDIVKVAKDKKIKQEIRKSKSLMEVISTLYKL